MPLSMSQWERYWLVNSLVCARGEYARYAKVAWRCVGEALLLYRFYSPFAVHFDLNSLNDRRLRIFRWNCFSSYEIGFFFRISYGNVFILLNCLQNHFSRKKFQWIYHGNDIYLEGSHHFDLEHFSMIDLPISIRT